MRNPEPHRFSETLRRIEEHALEKDLTLRELLILAGPGGEVFLSILLVLPFLQPIPLPGLSIPLGLAVTTLGFCEMIGSAKISAWLPERVSSTRLPSGAITKICRVASLLLIQIEKIGIRERGQSIFTHGATRRLVGFLIFLHGVVLALPIPIPLTNCMPSIVVLLLALASVEEDAGLLVVALLAVVIDALFFAALVLLPLKGFGLGPAWLHF
jgi:hypothetical protein